jgi:hypothetical protein
MTNTLAKSRAYLDFEDSLRLAESLIKIEKRYDDPPTTKDQHIVKGLRGGSIVLMVAAFENFLKSTVEEHLSQLMVPVKVPYRKLPPKLRMNTVFFTLEDAMKGPPSRERVLRVADVESACQKVVSETIVPKLLTDTKSNPNAKIVALMFSDIGKDDIFRQIKGEFDRKWTASSPVSFSTPAGFIEDKLNEIINRRHQVAHTATVLNVSRLDIVESISFLKLLARLLDLELNKHIRDIKR